MDADIPTRTLVDQGKANNREALEALALRFADRLDHYVRLRVGTHLRSTVETADVVQETFAEAFRSLDTFHWQNERSFLRWLKGIAEHVILRAAEQGRRGKILYVDHDHDIPCDAATPSKAMRRDERWARLREALDQLSPEYREVIVLARLKGLRIKEIAERMNRSENAVSLLLSRALAKLKQAFGDTESLNLPARPLDGSSHEE